MEQFNNLEFFNKGLNHNHSKIKARTECYLTKDRITQIIIQDRADTYEITKLYFISYISTLINNYK